MSKEAEDSGRCCKNKGDNVENEGVSEPFDDNLWDFDRCFVAQKSVRVWRRHKYRKRRASQDEQTKFVAYLGTCTIDLPSGVEAITQDAESGRPVLAVEINDSLANVMSAK